MLIFGYLFSIQNICSTKMFFCYNSNFIYIYSSYCMIILWIKTTLYRIGMIILIVNNTFLGRYFNPLLPRFRRYLRSLILLVALAHDLAHFSGRGRLKLEIKNYPNVDLDRSHPPKSLFNESVLSLEKLSRRDFEPRPLFNLKRSPFSSFIGKMCSNNKERPLLAFSFLNFKN